MLLKEKERKFLDFIQLLKNYGWKTSDLEKPEPENEKLYFKAFVPKEGNKFINVSTQKDIPNAMVLETIGNLPISEDKANKIPEITRRIFINTVQRDIAILNLLLINDFPGMGAQKLLFLDSIVNHQYIFDVLSSFINAMHLIEIRFQEIQVEYADIFNNLA
jgi:hypothetical protein